MIGVTPFDGGTRAIRRTDVVPGMDRLLWVEANYEEEASYVSNQVETNECMITIDDVRSEPYPLPFNYHMVLDFTDKYRTFGLKLKAYDQYRDDWSEVPAGNAVFKTATQVSTTDPDDLMVSDLLNQTEVRGWVDNPGDWIYIEPENVTSLGGTALEEQAHIEWHYLAGSVYRVEVPDNILFTPFDLTESGRYWIRDRDGRGIDPAFLDMDEDAQWEYHLRPRLWQIQARCRARYIWVTNFGYAYDDVDFIVQSKMRPPVAPWRHNVFVTSATQPIDDYLGTPVSYDHGINYAFYYSAAARQLSQEILKMQWHGWSSAYILMDVTPATLYIQAEVPRVNDVVCVVRPYDSAPASEIHIGNNVSMSSIYPRIPVGVFWSDFFDPMANG